MMRNLARFRLFKCGGLKYFIMPKKRRKTDISRFSLKFTTSWWLPVNSLLRILLILVCLFWWHNNLSSSEPISRTGTSDSDEPTTLKSSNNGHSASSDHPHLEPAKLVRLSGEQVQFECQLSPLAMGRKTMPLELDRWRGRRGVASRGPAGLLQDGALIDGGQAGLGANASGLPAPAHLRTRSRRGRAGGRWRRAHPGHLLMEQQQQQEADEENGEESGFLGQPDGQEDSVELILWYHSSDSGRPRPIYSVDGRQVQHQQQQQQPSPGASSSLVPIMWRQVQQQQYGSLYNNNGTSHQQQQMGGAPFIKSSIGNGGQLNYGPSASGQYATHNDIGGKLLRNVISASSKHYASSSLSSRISLLIRGMSAHLIIDGVEPSDAGQYKCRVDFKFARTRYQLVQLDVIAPLTLLQIKATNQKGIDLWPVNGINSTPSSSPPQLTKQKEEAANDGRQQSQQAPKSNEMSNLLQLHAAGQHHRHQHHDLNHDLMTASLARHSSPLVALVEANEDETMNLECAPKDGWPKARIGWWRADWPQEPAGNSKGPPWLLRPRLTPLWWRMGANGSLSIRVGLEPSGAGRNLTTNSDGIHSINASTVGAQPRANNGPPPPPPGAHVAQPKSDTTNGHKPNLASESTPAANDERWLAWMGGQLEVALSRFGQDFPENTLTKTTVWGAITQSINKSLDSIGGPVREGAAAEVRPVVTSDMRPGQADMLRVLRQHAPILYICGASNTFHPSFSSGGQQLAPGDVERHDKLAKIRPIFTSILVRPNARPKWIQMFLVGRRAASVGGSGPSSSAATGQIELSPLTPGQSLQLNLAPFGGKGERQLQFACQVGGSLPEAKVEWRRSYRRAIEDNSNEADADIIGVEQELRADTGEPLAAGGRFPGPSLMADTLNERSMDALGDGIEFGGQEMESIRANTSPTNFGPKWSPPTQWSLLRLHNISLTDHQTEIRCSASNERFNVGPDDGALTGSTLNASSGGSTKLSTWVRLNITHAPVVKLELEPDADRSLNNNDNNTLMELVGHSSSRLEAIKSAGSSDSQMGLNANFDYANDNQDGSQIKPILYGQNVTLRCSVTFANPQIQQPIEWSLNDTKPLDKLGKLVQVLGKIHEKQGDTTTNRYHFIERLIVQFNDISQQGSSVEVQLKCRASNSIGQVNSNRVSLVIGQLPHCCSDHLTNSSIGQRANSSNENDYLTYFDNNLPVHCPVMSDKSSSTFRWLVRRDKSATTATTFTKSADIKMSKLNLPSPGEADGGDRDNNALKIRCSVSDKFGSNHQSPCQIMVTAKREDAHDDDDDATVTTTINRPLTNYCVANVVQSNLAEKRQPQQDKNNLLAAYNQQQQQLIMNTDYETTASDQLAASSKPRLLLSIECKDNQFNDNKKELPASDQSGNGTSYSGGNYKDDEMIHFDLYHKRDTRFLKHLTSYSNRVNNLSLMLDLGNDLPLDDLEEQHFILMSITDANNRLKQPNMTLQFNTDPNAISYNSSIADQAAAATEPMVSLDNKQNATARSQTDRFPRTSESGHQDRLWVISSIVTVFLSSFVLVIIAWVCKSSSNGSIMGNNNNNTKSQGLKNNHSSANNNRSNHQAPVQVDSLNDMYLMGVDYHNQQQSANTLLTDPMGTHQDQHDRHHLDTIATSAALTSAPAPAKTAFAGADFLIIDPHTHERPMLAAADPARPSLAGKTSDPAKQPAILLLDPSCDSISCTSAYHHHQQEATDANDKRRHFEPMIYVHNLMDPHNQQHPDAILRAIYCGDPTDERLPSRSNSSSNSGQTPLGTTSNSTINNNIHAFQYFHQPTKDHHCSPPSINLAAASPVGLNFELNSQGELTMTDESSSFVHEDGTAGLELVCHQYPITTASNLSVLNAADYQLNRKSQVLPCPECMQSSSTSGPSWTLGRRGNSRLVAQMVDQQDHRCHYLSASQQEMPALSTSTLKRKPAASNNNAEKRAERVRFMDHHQLGGHDTSCC